MRCSMKSTLIYNDIEIVDLALKIKDHLVLGDLQIGFEEMLNKKGILIPRQRIESVIERIDAILKNVRVKTIVFNGDLKHEFGIISRQEWRDITRLLEHLVLKGYELIIVKGNHDVVLGPIVKKLNLKIVDYYTVGNITILHGDKIIPDLADVIIIGHEHPAISFHERKDERYKCFLVGTWHKKKLIVMPSFNTVTVGSDISKENVLSPFLKQSLKNFDVYIVEDKVYKFGKVKDIVKESS